MKKSNRKNKRNRKASKYNGINAFGQPCIEKFVVLEKETAWEQYMEILEDLDTAHDEVEYTVMFSGFTNEEIKEFHEKVERAMMIKAFFTNREFVRQDITVA